MTLATRRRAYWLLFMLSVSALASAAALVLPLYSPGFDPSALRAALGASPWTAFGLTIEAWRLAFAGGLLLAVFAMSLLFSILISFRKTASEEIFFLAFWAISCSFEAGRIVVARLFEAQFPPSWLELTTRVVLSARFAGYGAFFLAGLRSAGFRNERPGRAVLAVVGIGIAAAISLPLDSGSFDSTMLVRASYGMERLALAAVLAVITVVNLLVAAETTGERVFRSVALGACALLGGQTLLISGWRPETMAAGLILLVVGARIFVSRLHAHYLWQ